jgi:hypothetical protein
MGFGRVQNVMPANLPYLAGFKSGEKALKKKSCSAFFGGLGPQTMDAATYRFLNFNDPTVYGAGPLGFTVGQGRLE